MKRSLRELSGLPVWGATAAGAMLTLQFGASRDEVKRDGNVVAVGERALHVQCPWRFTAGGRVLVGSDDCIAGGDRPGVEGVSERLRGVLDGRPRRCTVHGSASADIRMETEDDPVLEAFAAAGVHGSTLEAWRVLAGSRHFVVMCDGSEDAG